MRIATLLVLVVACGGNPQSGAAFVGTYQVTAHHDHRMQGTTVACSDPGPVVTPSPPYIALIVDPFFNDPNFILMQTCTAPGTCTDTINTFNPGGPGLETLSANTQTGGGTNCNLYAGRNDATLTGQMLHIELLSWFDTPNIATADCTLPKAEALRDSPQCLEVETWDGTTVAR